jgi:hypothetical protein
MSTKKSVTLLHSKIFPGSTMSNPETPTNDTPSTVADTNGKAKATGTELDVEEDLDSSFIGVDEFEGPEPGQDPFEDTVDPFINEAPKEEAEEGVALHKPKGDSRVLQRQRRYVSLAQLTQCTSMEFLNHFVEGTQSPSKGKKRKAEEVEDTTLPVFSSPNKVAKTERSKAGISLNYNLNNK